MNICMGKTIKQPVQNVQIVQKCNAETVCHLIIIIIICKTLFLRMLQSALQEGGEAS